MKLYLILLTIIFVGFICPYVYSQGKLIENKSVESRPNLNNEVRKDILNWREGNTTIYSSSGNPKSKGLVFSIKYLNSWKAEDAGRPNIVQKFNKKVGSINIGYGITVIKQAGILKNEDIDEYIRDYESTLPSNMSLLSQNDKMLIDGERALFVELLDEYKANQTTFGDPIISYYSCYEIFYKDYIIDVIFSVGGANINKEDLYTDYVKYKPFFQTVASTFIIQSKWQ